MNKGFNQSFLNPLPGLPPEKEGEAEEVN